MNLIKGLARLRLKRAEGSPDYNPEIGVVSLTWLREDFSASTSAGKHLGSMLGFLTGVCVV